MYVCTQLNVVNVMQTIKFLRLVFDVIGNVYSTFLLATNNTDANTARFRVQCCARDASRGCRVLLQGVATLTKHRVKPQQITSGRHAVRLTIYCVTSLICMQR